MKKFLVGLTILLLASGCARTEVVKYDSIGRDSKPDTFDIEILESASIQKPYKVIGLIRLEKKRWRSVESIIGLMKKKCRNMGCDALMDLKVYTRPTHRLTTHYQAKAIAWK